MTIGKGHNRLDPFRAPHGNQQREQYWYIYCEWRTLSEPTLVTAPGQEQQGQQILVNAVNEVIDVHPIEHVFRLRGSRPGMMVKMMSEIPRWLFLAVERFNEAELADRVEKESKTDDRPAADQSTD